ncbi:MAG: sulfite exporter TauE/SafE family protein [Planctomycetota bacterium]
MEALLAAVLAASLVGSLHCAGMCGPFLAFVVGAGPARPAGPQASAPAGAPQRATRQYGALRLQLAYHSARGLGYVLLGAAAGAAGHFIDLAGALTGLRPLAAGLAGLTLVVLGAVALARLAGLRTPGARAWRLPEGPARALRAAQARALRMPPVTRALAIGATTTFLPCGWLYAFAVTAAGTGAPARGALVMAVFWAGTLPVLVALGAAVRGATRLAGPRLQAVASVALVVLGLWTLAGRVTLEPLALAQAVEAQAVQASGEALAAPAPDALPPCCAGHAAQATPTRSADEAGAPRARGGAADAVR